MEIGGKRLCVFVCFRGFCHHLLGAHTQRVRAIEALKATAEREGGRDGAWGRSKGMVMGRVPLAVAMPRVFLGTANQQSYQACPLVCGGIDGDAAKLVSFIDGEAA